MRFVRFLVASTVLAGIVVAAPAPASAAACDPPVVNPVACENTKVGNPPSEWDEAGSGDPSIQGFATDISVNKGATVRFKVKTNAGAYRVDIYRLGYYGGLGARKVATVTPSVPLPQSQPACATDAASGLVDCGTWAESAAWPIPADAVSGVYIGHLVRTDTGGGSHIVFVVRDDDSTSALLFQTSDTTWQAYNSYGGNSLYTGSPDGRAYKVSYNRPITTRATSAEDFFFDSEYPMVRWLEANGYDVSYSSGVDTDRRGGLLTQHRAFLSVGHDEYWSAAQRANVEAARAAGVHLAFFSGNEVFWKTRWESSIDGSGTAHRTLVSYKETHANAPIDPADPPTWTGTWRDARFSPPADGGRPENALTGTLFMVNGTRTDSIVVPAEDGKMRFWRNTGVDTLGAGQSATMPAGTLGYEWDADVDNGFRPPGLVRLSTATHTLSNQLLLDNGSTFGAGAATHHLTLYRASSGALVFGAGTVRWSWGLDSTHDGNGAAADTRMRQATVNLLADMGIQPSSLQPGLSPATGSSDVTAPTSLIAAPSAGSTVPVGVPVTVSGTASDAGGGVVGSVEVSVDGGATWHPATGRGSWSYTFTPGAAGPLTIKSRAADDSANLEVPSAGVSVTVGQGGPPPDGQTLWSATVVPTVAASSDPNAVELGVKFRSDLDGFITGVRFYKGAGNTGTHVGSLWSAAGTRLATGTFTGESSGGWQQLLFSSPVPITANTTYVASYHAPAGRYAVDEGYFTVARDNAPLHAPATSTTPNGVYRYGASGFPTETYQASNYWVDVVFKATIAPDTTPPTIVERTPAPNATGTPLTGIVTARFDEAVQPGSVAMSLVDAGGATVPGTTSYDGATNRAIFTPASSLAASATHTATVSGALDLAGNAMGPPVTWSFTTGSGASGGAISLWSAGVVPGTAAVNDTASLELGIKLRSDVDGVVTGVRFYKGPGNEGPHVGSLWSSSGVRLATATFSGETSSGWQQVSFASPVPVAAGQTFIASYFAPSGRYAVDQGYFAAGGVDNAPLHALSNTTSPNGVYRYGTTSGFPTDSHQASNYWVDVVFEPSGPDTFPPAVSATTPVGGSVGVAVGATVSATFTEPVQPSTISFVLTDPVGTAVPATVTYDASINRSTLTPSAPLAPLTRYAATLTSAVDLAGNPMAGPFTWSFTTRPAPLTPVGPGGPVLVVTSEANRFSSYLAEILRNEGLNHWAAADVSTVSASMLASYDVVLLGETPLTASQVSTLAAWVDAGGNLIAMRPDKQLTGLLGLTDVGATLPDAYLRVSTAAQPGAGITDQTIQFHGTADRYALTGATSVAELHATGSTTSATGNPAVTLRSVGTSGGQAAAFTFDLARSVVYTRQGNPAWAGTERDGRSPIRSNDLFFGAAAGDSRPDWVDLDKVAIPQADEQQRLLVKLIEQMNQDRKPLPRFWYLPNGAKAAVFLSGDDHTTGGNPGTPGRFDQLLAAGPPGCSVADWGCPRMSSYIYPGNGTTNAQAASYTAQGFELGTHVNTGCANWTPSSLASAFDQQLGAVSAQYPSIPPSTSQRIHCIVWSDWATAAWTQLTYGVRLDTNYYYWPPGWVNDRPGFFTGSGMPMRFADLDGSTIDVYQAATQMTDESGQAYPFTVDRLLDNALGPLGYYGVFTANMHTDLTSSSGSDAIVASAAARGVPVISGRQLVTWLDGRNSSSFSGLSWNGNDLTFAVTAAPGAANLQGLVPVQTTGGLLKTITRGGVSVPFQVQTIKGTSYAFFPAATGDHLVRYEPDTTAPTISAVASSVTTSSATITWSTDEASTSVVDYGTAAGALTSTASSAGLVTSHSVVLPSLAANTTYYFRVRSADASANEAVSPPSSAGPATLTTQGSVTDSTVAQLAAGSLGGATYIAATGDGEVTLAPLVGQEFSGTSLPSGWSSSSLQSGGTTTFAGGAVTANGTQVRTSSSYGGNRSLEFVATFTALNQRAGLSADFSTRPWARFAVRNSSQLLVATGVNGSTNRSTNLSGAYVGAPHRYRIDWNSTSVVYSVDGTVVATHNISPTGNMRPFAGDGTAGGPGVSVSWMRLTPYPSTGTYTSRVLDAGRVTTWRTATWLASLPSGTGLTIRVRSGSTPTPDTTWTSYSTVAASGATISSPGRYLQYQAVLTSSSSRVTPELQQVAFVFG